MKASLAIGLGVLAGGAYFLLSRRGQVELAALEDIDIEPPAPKKTPRTASAPSAPAPVPQKEHTLVDVFAYYGRSVVDGTIGFAAGVATMGGSLNKSPV